MAGPVEMARLVWILAGASLKILAGENFAESYALTLREWRRRFLEKWPQAEWLGFETPSGGLGNTTSATARPASDGGVCHSPSHTPVGMWTKRICDGG